MYTLEDIHAVDPEIAAAITAEFDRQNSHIELIASENWVSPAVMSAMGSILTNKYAEGYPGARYNGVAKSLTRQNNWLLIGLSNYSVLNSLTYNRTPEHKLTLLCSSLA